MKPLKRTAIEELAAGMSSFWEISEYKGIIDFALSDVSICAGQSNSLKVVNRCPSFVLMEKAEK